MNHPRTKRLDMASVEFAHVEKVFPDGTHALRDCSLRIEDGELLVCVGPSGCGKSTLLRLLAGLESVTGGTLRIGARVVNDLPPQERNVAMVFQDYALYPFLTVRRNLEFPLKMRKLPREEMRRRVEWVSGLLGIGDLLERLPKQLSGGQRQRVAMGRALVREPTVFLLDEPLSNLDAQLRVQVRADIGELQRRTQTTMIYVTHDQAEAMTLGNRVAVLDQGRLQQVATPQDVYDHPANVFVAGFIGSPPMNLFPTRRAFDAHGRIGVVVGDAVVAIAPERLGGRGQDDQSLTAGIRPEALRIASASASNRVAARVAHVEYLGHETLVHAVVGEAGAAADVSMIVRLQGTHDVSKGQPLDLEVDGARLHLFAADGTALA